MRALSNTTDMKTANVRAPQRPAVAARSARVSRQQNKQVQVSALSSCTSVLRPQQVQRSSPIVSVAAQEAPATQQTATKVRSPRNGITSPAAAVAVPHPKCLRRPCTRAKPARCIGACCSSMLKATIDHITVDVTDTAHISVCCCLVLGVRSGSAWLPMQSSSAMMCRTSPWLSSCVSVSGEAQACLFVLQACFAMCGSVSAEPCTWG